MSCDIVSSFKGGGKPCNEGKGGGDGGNGCDGGGGGGGGGGIIELTGYDQNTAVLDYLA